VPHPTINALVKLHALLGGFQSFVYNCMLIKVSIDLPEIIKIKYEADFTTFFNWKKQPTGEYS
jgi:hypothetical protein